jgi:hypothetical protein
MGLIRERYNLVSVCSLTLPLTRKLDLSVLAVGGGLACTSCGGSK